MKREDLIHSIAYAIARMEGFFLTEEEAAARGLRWPTKAQRLANPGNIRKWADRPQTDGYVDFMKWAKYDPVKANLEGWRVLRVLIGQYIDGKYTGGKSPTLYQFFERYAPAGDGNNPRKYAEFVAERVGIPPDVPLKEVIDAGQKG
jgi:hypothetical protein